MIEIRIYAWQNHKYWHISTLISPCVPQIGSKFQINDESCEIYEVIWMVIDGKIQVDVNCDASDCHYDLSKSNLEIGVAKI